MTKGTLWPAVLAALLALALSAGASRATTCTPPHPVATRALAASTATATRPLAAPVPSGEATFAPIEPLPARELLQRDNPSGLQAAVETTPVPVPGSLRPGSSTFRHVIGKMRCLDPATYRQPETVGVDIPILMYHYLVDGGEPPTDYYITADLFDRQMAALAAYGYEAVTLQEFLAYRDGSAQPPDHPVLLTFDDGEVSVYSLARPALTARGMRATLFVTTGFLGEQRATSLFGWMLWSQVEAMYQEGFPVESHSISHPMLTELPPEQAWEEIDGSRVEIENRLGSVVRFFAYPGGYGAYDPAVRGLVQAAGYQAGVAAWPDGIANTVTSDLWALPRRLVRQHHAVDLDRDHPELFFMRLVDPQFPLPQPVIGSVTNRHGDGRNGVCFAPGEAITVTIILANEGDPAEIRATLSLDDDGDSGGTYYQGVAGAYLQPDETAQLEFELYLPAGVTEGRHLYSLDVGDPAGVLGFLHSGWQAAFVVQTACRQAYLPVVFP